MCVEAIEQRNEFKPRLVSVLACGVFNSRE